VEEPIIFLLHNIFARDRMRIIFFYLDIRRKKMPGQKCFGKEKKYIYSIKIVVTEHKKLENSFLWFGVNNTPIDILYLPSLILLRLWWFSWDGILVDCHMLCI
jgi:hypothetical protein